MLASRLFVWILAFVASAGCALGQTAKHDPCAALSPTFFEDWRSGGTKGNASRELNPDEAQLLARAKPELLERVNYGSGAVAVDFDNDGTDDLLVWAIRGSGRFVNAEIYELPPLPLSKQSQLVRKTATMLGVLTEPAFFRYQGTNYVALTESGVPDEDALVVKFSKLPSGRYRRTTVCQTKRILKTSTNCRHPACQGLIRTVENPAANHEFVRTAWPHNYAALVGLNVYFPSDQQEWDFDNTRRPSRIWRIGREGYGYHHIYWDWLAEGESKPTVSPELRAQSESARGRSVLPGLAHDRLRRTLAQQSEILTKHLGHPVSLPKEAAFFLFKAHGDRTYWAWDLADRPYGEKIHVLYTNANKSDYIGSVGITGRSVLTQCTDNCVSNVEP